MVCLPTLILHPRTFHLTKHVPETGHGATGEPPAFPTQVGSGGITRIRQDLKGNTKRGVERNCQVFFSDNKGMGVDMYIYI